MTDWPTVGLTAVLIGVTGYYAWQNKRMVVEMRRQNRPYVYVVFEKGSLIVHNAGNRSAHRVAIRVVRDINLAESEMRDEKGELVLALAKASSHAACREGIRTLVPGASRAIGRVAYTRPGHPERFGYVVSYRDGVGTRYEEKLSEEYET